MCERVDVIDEHPLYYYRLFLVLYSSNASLLNSMPLKVIVVGAGIAGLCAATALRQEGHHVEVCFTISTFSLFFILFYSI